MRNRFLLRLALILSAIGAPLCPIYEATAQTTLFPKSDGEVVDLIVLSGNRRNADEDLLYYIKQKTNAPLSLDVVSEDVKRLYRMKLYDDIQVDFDRIDGKNVLTYYFKEKPSIATISFAGNDEIDTDDLQKKIDLREASPLDIDKINDNAEKIKRYYDDEGFFLAEVNPEIRDREDGDKDVVFKIREYDKVKVKRITILGNQALSDDDIKAHIFTREKSLLGMLSGAGQFKQEEFKRDLQRVAAWYSENGYPDAHVTDSQIQLSEDRSAMYITLTVEEGDYTTIGNIDIMGETLDDDDEVQKLISLEKGQGFKLSQLFDDVKKIQDYYGDKGYAYAQVEPRRRAGLEPNTIDISYDINPGEPVTIGKILITGNMKTEDKVIRREILVQ